MKSSRTYRVKTIAYLLYNLTLLLLSPLIALFLAQRYRSGKSRAGWSERWGHLPPALRDAVNGRPLMWVHAVSAGEVVAAVPILRELRRELPDHALVLSVITEAGQEMAAQQATPFVDGIFYAPFDLPFVVRRVVQQLRPVTFVSLESELWPNLLHALKRQGATTVMVNGRISDKNFARVKRYGRGLFRWMLGNMDRLLMQSEADAERIIELGNGPLKEPGRVRVLGNSKFDQEIETLTDAQVANLRNELHLPADVPVFVAGSTRSPEEEAQVIAAYKTMRAQVPDLCLLIAPRQIARAEELAEALQAVGLEPVRRTQLPKTNGTVSVLILDTIGELARVYAVATFAFVGNSFAPVVKGGGQNILQPLAHGKPVLFGPLTATIRSETALALGAGIGFRVADGAELATRGLELLHDATRLQHLSETARALVAANRGVSARYAQAIAGG